MIFRGYLKPVLKVAIFSVFLFCVNSCNKEPFLVAVVTVHNTGASNAGGCGWVLEVDSAHWYSAVNLPAQFEQDSLPVKITYKEIQNTPDCTNSLFIKGVLYLHKVENI